MAEQFRQQLTVVRRLSLPWRRVAASSFLIALAARNVAPVEAAPNVAAQLLAVAWDNGVYHIDSITGAAEFVGSALDPPLNNPLFLNALARSPDGNYIAGGLSSSLFDISPVDGRATRRLTLRTLTHIRGLAFSPAGTLFAIANETGPSLLVTIDLTTGASTHVGSLSRESLQSLEFSPDGILYSYDTGTSGIGLVTINPTNAVVTDVNPVISGGTVDLQSLAFAADGTLIGGGQFALYTVNQRTGETTLRGGNGFHDVRGIAFLPIPEATTLSLAILGLVMHSIVRPSRNIPV